MLVLSCVRSNDGPTSDLSAPHTLWDRYHRGYCRLHPAIVGVVCSLSGSPMPAVGCDVGENRSESPARIKFDRWSQTGVRHMK